MHALLNALGRPTADGHLFERYGIVASILFAPPDSDSLSYRLS